MSLTRALMNGGTYGVTIDASKYTHDNGASRIAIESIEELHEIFIESFYNTEQAELAAATEGVALEGSRYEAVFEGAISDTMEKVKAFLKKLWEKVKAFLHQVKRYIDAMFMSGKEFAKKYKKDITEANKKLKDFSFTMYKYDDTALDTLNKDIDVETRAQEIFDETDAVADEFRTAADKANAGKDNLSEIESACNKQIELLKKKTEEDALIKKYYGKYGATDSEDVDEAFFGHWRDKATGKEDKEEIDISDLTYYMNVLIDSKALSNIDSYNSKVDRCYKKAIKMADEKEKEWNNARSEIKGDSNDDKIARAKASFQSKVFTEMSSSIARLQSIENKFITSWKTALKERDTVYKQLLVAGMSNAKKNK